MQISWLLQKPTDLDLHCLQRQGISEFRRSRVNSGIMFLIISPYVMDTGEDTASDIIPGLSLSVERPSDSLVVSTLDLRS